MLLVSNGSPAVPPWPSRRAPAHTLGISRTPNVGVGSPLVLTSASTYKIYSVQGFRCSKKLHICQ